MLPPNTEFGGEGQDDSPAEIPPLEGWAGGNGTRDLQEPIAVTTLRRAGFPVFPRVAARHNEVTDEPSVRTPVDAHAIQGRLGCRVDRNLGASDDGDGKGVAEQVIWLPGGLQVSLRADGIDGSAI